MIPTTLIVQEISMINNNSKESEIEIQNYQLRGYATLCVALVYFPDEVEEI
jgi:hypothetical protein